MGGRIDDTWRWITAALSLGEPTRPSRRIRALGWGGLVGMVHDSERAMDTGPRRGGGVCAGRRLDLALATMLHASAISDFFHRTAAVTELAEECGARSRRLVTAGVAPWRRWIGGSISLVHTDYDAALPELREAAAQFGDIGNAWDRALALRHVADIATTRGNYDEAEQRCSRRSWVRMPWEPTPSRAG